MLIKQPFEAITAPVPFTGLPAGLVIASVTSVDIVARGRVAPVLALTSAGNTATATGIDVELVGGTDGERYLVTARGVDSDGHDLEAELEVAVVDLTWTAPDGTTAYVTIAQFVTRVTLDEAVRLTDENGTGRIDPERLVAALVDASAFADTYLSGKFATPVTPVPQLLTTIVIDLALSRLYRGALPDAVAAAKVDAMRLLRDIASGAATLPGAAVVEPAAVSSTPVLFEAPPRRFSRESLGGF